MVFLNQESLSLSRDLCAISERSGVVYPPKESVSAVWRGPEHQPPTPTPTPSATAHLSGCDFTYTLEEAGVTLARGDNQVALARGGDLEEVGVDASGSDRRARAGALDHERLWRVTRRVEGDDVVGVLGAREGVRLRVLAQLDRALLACY